MTRLHKFGVCVLVLATVPTISWADETCTLPPPPNPILDRLVWGLSAKADEPFALPDHAGLPSIVDEDVESSAEISASWSNKLTVKFGYLNTKDGDGESLAITHKDKCPILDGTECVVGVSFRETPLKTTRRYDAGISGKWSLLGLTPKWKVTATHNASQIDSDTFLSPELETPFKCFFGERRLTLTTKVGGSYSFQDKQIKPTWAVGFEFMPNGPNTNVTVGVSYGGVATLDSSNEFDVKNTASAFLSIVF